jgi:hypothetical protein
VPLYPFLAASYVLIALLFVPIGHWVGCTLVGDRPLARYAYNIVGSLGGVAIFTLLSAAAARPWVWIACAGVSLLSVLRDAPTLWRAGGLVVIGLATLIARLSTGDAKWSPYQKITTAPIPCWAPSRSGCSHGSPRPSAPRWSLFRRIGALRSG